jgi:hypothetical protein
MKIVHKEPTQLNQEISFSNITSYTIYLLSFYMIMGTFGQGLNIYFLLAVYILHEHTLESTAYINLWLQKLALLM